jgi:hypothetical protein
MATIDAPKYKDLAADSHMGNVCADILEYTMTGAEPNGTVIRLRRKNQYNTYLSMRLLALAVVPAALTTVDVGYIDREEDGTNDLDLFANDANINADQDIDLFAAPIAVPKRHDIALTINANNAANAGVVIKIIVMSMVTSG